ncbi:girdin-like [Phymastichus coffea]|uniref:girdin-like n=1 Tax=Phymastichus coffea TaxID=108790 RepID=UPI00273CE711|nr:girdin-like [Phymastichus coffea]
MYKINEVSEIDEFLAGPLVIWFASCLEMLTDEKVSYNNLVNGYLMHNVFLQMNLQVHDTDVYLSTIDSTAWRCRNLLGVLNNIRHFYEDELGQLILRLPDVEKLGREPEHNVRETEILLQLLLGCAVQCPQKQRFIEKIRRLDETSQLALAQCISQIIEVPDIVISTDMLVNVPNAQKAIDCIKKICKERDDYKIQLRCHREHIEEQLNEDICEKLQLKFKVTDLAEQLRQKSDELEDIQAHLKEYEKKLLEVNEKLVMETKNVKLYKDDLDEARARAEKAELLEQDIARYKKKLNELDFCKARIKELEKSNKDFADSKTVLRKQLASKKVDEERMRDLKRQVTKLIEQINNLTIESAKNRDKYSAACEEIKELQCFVKESCKNSDVNHHYEGLPSLKDDLLLNQKNIQIDKLQADNQSFISYNETLKVHLFRKSNQISTLTHENKELKQENKSLNLQIMSMKENLIQKENKIQTLQCLCQKTLSKATKLQQLGLENLNIGLLLKNTQKCSSTSDKSMPINSIGIDASKFQTE